MKKYKKELLLCYFVYLLLFIAVALAPFQIIGEGGRTAFFLTLYNTNLFIPFGVNSLFLIYIVLKIILDYLKNKGVW